MEATNSKGAGILWPHSYGLENLFSDLRPKGLKHIKMFL